MEQRIDRVQQVEVRLHTKDKDENKIVIDLNTQGLVSLNFERYMSDTTHKGSNVLTELNMTLFDITGYNLMGAIQRAHGNIYLEYGYKGDLSPVYKLTPTKYNVVQNNRGIMLGVQGFGVQREFQADAESYPIGTPIKPLLVAFAKRNNWYTGSRNEFIQVSPKFKTHKILVREAGISDYAFIKRDILPLLSTHSVFKDGTMKHMVSNAPDLYEMMLQDTASGRFELHIFPTGTQKIDRKVWQYNYGVDTQSQVIEMTNKIDYSWILDGITLRIPLVGDFIIKDDDVVEAELKELMENEKEKIIKIFKDNDIVLPELLLTYKFQFYEASEIEHKTLEDIVEEKMRDIANTFNKMELTVIGNHHINATDLIYLNAVNKMGDRMIQHGFWRITYIEEVIGLGGYQTKLQLVRETDKVILPTPTFNEGVGETHTLRVKDKA